MSEYKEDVKQLIDSSDAVEISWYNCEKDEFVWSRAVKTWESTHEVCFLISHAYEDGSPSIQRFLKCSLSIPNQIRPIPPKKVKKKGFMAIGRSFGAASAVTTHIYDTEQVAIANFIASYGSSQGRGEPMIAEIEWEEEA